MKPRTLRVFCTGCKGEFDCYIDEDFGEAHVCKGCGVNAEINFDKNTITIDAQRAKQNG